MKWILAAPYLQSSDKGLLWSEVEKQSNSVEFIVSPADYTHNRSRPQSSLKDWKDYWRHSKNTWQLAQNNKAGIITAFPQLPVCTGIQKRLSGKSTPIIASTFNLGALHGQHKQFLARSALKRINRFIVHSSAEISNYSNYLNLDSNKFEFIPLHKQMEPITENEEIEAPFILAMGSANRDYATLFKAIKLTGYPLTVVAPTHALAGLDIPPSVTVVSNLSLDECRALVQRSRISIAPIANEKTASGQVTIIEAMMYQKPVIATDTIGTRDYIINGETGFLTQTGAVAELAEKIDDLWTNLALRQSISMKAFQYVKNELNHQKTAARWVKILNSV